MASHKIERILIVEDEVELAEMLSTELQRHRFQCKVCLNGKQGLQAIRSFQPDLAIVDIVLPQVSGLAIIEEMLDLVPEVPVICISGAYADQALLAYANIIAVYEKPFKVELIIDAIQDFCKIRKSS